MDKPAALGLQSTCACWKTERAVTRCRQTRQCASLYNLYNTTSPFFFRTKEGKRGMKVREPKERAAPTAGGPPVLTNNRTASLDALRVDHCGTQTSSTSAVVNLEKKVADSTHARSHAQQRELQLERSRSAGSFYWFDLRVSQLLPGGDQSPSQRRLHRRRSEARANKRAIAFSPEDQ